MVSQRIYIYKVRILKYFICFFCFFFFCCCCCCCCCVLLHCHTAVLPRCYTAILLYCHTVKLPYCRTSILLYCHAAVLPYCCTANFTQWFIVAGPGTEPGFLALESNAIPTALRYSNSYGSKITDFYFSALSRLSVMLISPVSINVHKS